MSIAPEQSSIKERLRERVAFRIALSQGQLKMPVSISRNNIPTNNTLSSMWHALWHNFLNNFGGISTPYWYDKVGSPKLFNTFIKHLSKEGWITSTVIPARKWAEITLNIEKIYQYITPEDLTCIRQGIKYDAYTLKCDTTLRADNITKQNGVKSDTGLKRPGFAKAGTTKFRYDTTLMGKYRTAIILNVTKSMRILAQEHNLAVDGADYTSVSVGIVDSHIADEWSEYTLGKNYNDSRGRAISSGLKKVWNPIGFKDARALLIAEPTEVTNNRNYTRAMYLFIAELSGVKHSSSEAQKARQGRQHYLTRHLPNLDLTDEEDRKDLHELMWLERVYNELDAFFSRDKAVPFYNTVPIELDASASLLQILSVLVNHKPYMEATNVIGTDIQDPWYIPDLTRKQVKFACTPMLYGSSSTPKELWYKNNVPFTTKESAAMSFEISDGFYAVANDFKNMVIDNVQPAQTMQVQLWNETFTIECNRFKNTGEYTKIYPIYDSEKGMIKSIAHTHTKKVPDLKQFKRYFQTLLIHNLDSQVADYVSNNIKWILSIHDAFIVSPVDATRTRELYSEMIEAIYADRKNILNNYFKTIKLSNKATRQWTQLQEELVPFKGKTFKCSPMALK